MDTSVSKPNVGNEFFRKAGPPRLDTIEAGTVWQWQKTAPVKPKSVTRSLQPPTAPEYCALEKSPAGEHFGAGKIGSKGNPEDRPESGRHIATHGHSAGAEERGRPSKSPALLYGLCLICLMAMTLPAGAFDHTHVQWDTLVSRHVYWNTETTASRVDYQGFAADKPLHETYLNMLPAVSLEQFNSWSREQQLAFLINAYNALTVKLIMTRYPDLTSIRDLGSLFTNPWKKKFFTLLGKERNLDWIEHTMIRQPGVFDDPRIHAAVNCASIGCPALWDRAYTADNLEQALDSAMKRFLRDRTRNRYDPASGTLELSRIFDWYRSDFTQGFRGTHSLHGFLGLYADSLSDSSDGYRKITDPATPIRFLEYNWNLNSTENTLKP